MMCLAVTSFFVCGWVLLNFLVLQAYNFIEFRKFWPSFLQSFFCQSLYPLVFRDSSCVCILPLNIIPQFTDSLFTLIYFFAPFKILSFSYSILYYSADILCLSLCSVTCELQAHTFNIQLLEMLSVICVSLPLRHQGSPSPPL